jgi:hypothetical protein
MPDSSCVSMLVSASCCIYDQTQLGPEQDTASKHCCVWQQSLVHYLVHLFCSTAQAYLSGIATNSMAPRWLLITSAPASFTADTRVYMLC